MWSDDVNVTFDLTGFKHDSGHAHGIHVHEFGDMSQGCQSLGGHFNPEGVKHKGSRETSDDHGSVQDDSDLHHIHFYLMDP